MPATLIIGGQWGDEGKAKIVDHLMADYDVVIRYQGGANAGHTVVSDEGKFAFHQIPSGLLYPHVSGIMGNGMVVDPFSFIEELNQLMTRGISVEDRLFISSAASVVMPYHRILDNVYETDRKDESIGSTGKGIGPAYEEKHSRNGMRMGDFLLDKQQLYEEVEKRVERNNRILKLFNIPSLSPRKVASDIVNTRDLVSHFVADTQEMVFRMNREGKRIMLEGAQGTLLDIDHGTYPYVTSSTCTAGGAISGSGLPPFSLGKIIGVFKSYTTRVGNGPFPTELDNQEGENLRKKGNEFGTTTGRPRRCGWFDLVAARYSVQLNGLTDIAMTKLDVLSGLPVIRYCVAYQLDGERITSLPQNAAKLSRCRPVYEEVSGWEEGELKVDSYSDLPAQAKAFIEKMEEFLEVRISFISNGPGRNEIIKRATS